MGKPKDILGLRFGKLVVTAYIGSFGSSQHARWRCICDCGNETQAAGVYLRRGSITSCGCVRVSTQFAAVKLDTPGASKSRVYAIWAGMLARCSETARGKSRRLYFEKGVRVCDQWQKFSVFLADMGEPPPGASIDRIDGSKGYEPSNCRWATPIEQANNTSANKRVSCFGETRTVAEWARLCGIKHNTLTYRLRRGWPPEKAINRTIEKVTNL